MVHDPEEYLYPMELMPLVWLIDTYGTEVCSVHCKLAATGLREIATVALLWAASELV